MLLAAGLGLRLRPLTLLRAKPALPVLNRPLIHWTLEALAAAGVDEVVINLHHLPRSVTAAVGDGSAFGLRVRWSRESEILGTGGGPRRVRRLLGEEPVLLVNGDMLMELDLTRLVARHRRTGARATLGLRPNPDPERYPPVITARNGRVLALRGRPAGARGTASMFAGVHVLDPALLERLPPGNSDTVGDLYPRLIAAGERVDGLRLRGLWLDIGTPALYLEAHRRLLARGWPAPGAVASGARIGAGARLRRVSVGAGASVGEGARVEDSVLWDGARVGAGARVRRSVVTRGGRIQAGERVEGMMVFRPGCGAPERVAVTA
jgi:NDP-sugar pyrophosphorylase family protein